MKNTFYRDQLRRRQRVVFEKFMDDLDSFDEDESSCCDYDAFIIDFKSRLKGHT